MQACRSATCIALGSGSVGSCYCDGAVRGPTTTPLHVAEGVVPLGAKSMQARNAVQLSDVSLALSARDPIHIRQHSLCAAVKAFGTPACGGNNQATSTTLCKIRELTVSVGNRPVRGLGRPSCDEHVWRRLTRQRERLSAVHRSNRRVVFLQHRREATSETTVVGLAPCRISHPKAKPAAAAHKSQVGRLTC